MMPEKDVFNLNLLKRKSNFIKKINTTIPMKMPNKNQLYKKNKNTFKDTVDFRNTLHN